MNCSLNQTPLTFLTNLDDSINSGDFCERGYLSLIQKDSGTHMYGLAVYVKEGLPFTQDLSLENSADSYLVFDWLFFTQCLTSFSYIDHLLCFCAWFLILFHLTSTHLQTCLSLETLASIIRTGLPILVEMIDLMDSAIIYLK